MREFSRELNSQGLYSTSKGEGKFSWSFVHALHKTSHWAVSRLSRAADVIHAYSCFILLVRPFAFFRPSLPLSSRLPRQWPIYSNFSWVLQSHQKKLKTMLAQNLANKVYYEQFESDAFVFQISQIWNFGLIFLFFYFHHHI